MAETFSWTLALRSSYRSKTFWNRGRVTAMMTPRATTSTTMATRKTRLSWGLIKRHRAREASSIRGERMPIRRITIKAFCRLVTSVVIRVTRPAVLNLSMLEKEKVWTLAKRLSRRLQAYPAEARAAYRLPPTPQARERKARASISTP